MQRPKIIILILLGMLLAACSQETDLTLRKNERWEWKNQFTFNFDLLPDIGGDIIEGIGLSFSTGALVKRVLKWRWIKR